MSAVFHEMQGAHQREGFLNGSCIMSTGNLQLQGSPGKTSFLVGFCPQN